MRVAANSKINLFLRVVGERADGRHDIETVFHNVDLADRLTVEPSEGIETYADDPALEELEPDEDIVVVAARSLAERAGTDKGARIHIAKQIPVGAGLAGGSASAAATLVALNELWGTRLDRADLLEIAATIGSDVSFCLAGGTAIGRGAGELLEPLVGVPKMWFVLGFDPRPLLTGDVYRAWKETTIPAGSLDEMVAALRSGDVRRVAGCLHNDLQQVALRLRPELRDGLTALEDAGALGSLVSGSGPTLFALCRDEAGARRAADRVEDRFPRVAVVSSAEACVEELA